MDLVQVHVIGDLPAIAAHRIARQILGYSGAGLSRRTTPASRANALGTADMFKVQGCCDR